jgi:hypothetical protein
MVFRGGWSGRELARQRGQDAGAANSPGWGHSPFALNLPRFQLPPIEPGVRFSRTRLPDALHRRCSTGARQDRFALGATTIPLREIKPRLSRDRYTLANPHDRER